MSKCVKEVYEKIAGHFDTTRYAVWGCVKRFLDGVHKCSIVGDIGCGNGKNMAYRKDLM
jgi:hypothetical protein